LGNREVVGRKEVEGSRGLAGHSLILQEDQEAGRKPLSWCLLSSGRVDKSL
jgi:hypothetical protein